MKKTTAHTRNDVDNAGLSTSAEKSDSLIVEKRNIRIGKMFADLFASNPPEPEPAEKTAPPDYLKISESKVS